MTTVICNYYLHFTCLFFCITIAVLTIPSWKRLYLNKVTKQFKTMILWITGGNQEGTTLQLEADWERQLCEAESVKQCDSVTQSQHLSRLFKFLLKRIIILIIMFATCLEPTDKGIPNFMGTRQVKIMSIGYHLSRYVKPLPEKIYHQKLSPLS